MKYTPEIAQYIIANNSDVAWKDFFEAVRDGELPAYYCQKFAFKRLHSDDLPGPRLVGVWHPHYPEMKCRGNVIYGIIKELHQCIEQEMIKDSDLIASLEQLFNRQWNAAKGSKGEYWTTREEIDLINSTLDRTIHSIETTYGITTDWEKERRRLDEERQIRRKAFGA